MAYRKVVIRNPVCFPLYLVCSIRCGTTCMLTCLRKVEESLSASSRH